MPSVAAALALPAALAVAAVPVAPPDALRVPTPLREAEREAQALANHSCSPTAVPTFAGSLIRLRAVRELRVGDHVTTAYLDLAEPLGARQLDLEARYFFR